MIQFEGKGIFRKKRDIRKNKMRFKKKWHLSDVTLQRKKSLTWKKYFIFLKFIRFDGIFPKIVSKFVFEKKNTLYVSDKIFLNKSFHVIANFYKIKFEKVLRKVWNLKWWQALIQTGIMAYLTPSPSIIEFFKWKALFYRKKIQFVAK